MVCAGALIVHADDTIAGCTPTTTKTGAADASYVMRRPNTVHCVDAGCSYCGVHCTRTRGPWKKDAPGRSHAGCGDRIGGGLVTACDDMEGSRSERSPVGALYVSGGYESEAEDCGGERCRGGGPRGDGRSGGRARVL
jgi:hypothetical protein